MSLRGYKPKGKKAPWTQAFPDQVRPIGGTMRDLVPERAGAKLYDFAKALSRRNRPNPVSKARRRAGAAYRPAARAFVAEAVRHGRRCPVATVIPELVNGTKYGHPISSVINQVHHAAGRGHGGRGPLLMDRRLWIALGTQGHRWIDANRDEARRRGWLAPLGWYDRPVPEDCPVARLGNGGVAAGCWPNFDELLRAWGVERWS